MNPDDLNERFVDLNEEECDENSKENKKEDELIEWREWALSYEDENGNVVD